MKQTQRPIVNLTYPRKWLLPMMPTSKYHSILESKNKLNLNKLDLESESEGSKLEGGNFGDGKLTGAGVSRMSYLLLV